MPARPSLLVFAVALALALALAACGGAGPNADEPAPVARLPDDAPADDTHDDALALDPLVLLDLDPGRDLDPGPDLADAPPVHAALLRQRAALDACYRAALVAEPTLAGDLRLWFEISARGEVLGAASDPAGGQAGVAAVAGCVVGAVRGLTFPARATAGVTRVELPLVLRPEVRS
jgi:hypothetical protein